MGIGMKLKVKYFDVDTLENEVILHEEDCIELGVQEMDRVKIMTSTETMVAIVERSDSVLKRGEIGLMKDTFQGLKVKQGDVVVVSYAPKPESVRHIRSKMDGKVLNKDDINSIIQDIVEYRLSNIEVSAWLTSLYINGMNLEEIAAMTNAMVKTGDVLQFERGPVFDFHSIGGVPGNKITPIVVSIIAEAGLLIPKTSSRAISSAVGTSDFVEVFCDVDIDALRLKEITETIGGAFTWGGSINLAPVDDIVIKVEYPLSINPRAQMLASIMSKKKAISADYLLIDLPTGEGTKISNVEEARAYARDFMTLGDMLGMHVECAITYGDQPVGSAIGPALEARECIRILEGAEHPSSVVEKACELAGMVLEMGGHNNGSRKAREILSSGAALKKFREIVAAQNGNPELTADDIKPGEFTFDFQASRFGYVNGIRNKDLVVVARAAGSPNDKGAGILLHAKKGHRVELGDTLFTIYADNEAKLQRAVDTAKRLQPLTIEGMLITKIPGGVPQL